jgi:dolichyl-phosphate beta-glucosyltransferase
VNLLRRITLVGTTATVVDVVLFVVLASSVGWPVWWADAAAVAVATAVSWCLHAWVTFPDDPSRGWFERLGTYLSTAVTALLVDVAVVSFLYWWLEPGWWLAYLVIKAPALAAAFAARMITYRDTMFVSVRDVQGEPAPRPPAPGRRRLSVVVPAYREADRIAETVAEIRVALAELDRAGELEIVVVDDGSPDDTADRAEAAGADVVVRSTPNRGKGAAVRQGVLAAGGRTVAFTDADLSYAPDQLLRLLDGVEAGWDVVVGSRQHVETRTVVRAGRLREVGGRIINLLTGIVLLGRYRDTQCGLKAMRSDVGRVIFGHAHIDGFAFDVEVFHLVERYRFTLLEVPVEVVNSSRSTVNVARDAVRLVRDLFRIRRWGRIGLYEADDAELPARSDGTA